MALGLYYHIPYCFSKCRYCDFYSAPGARGVPEAFVAALLRELDAFTGGEALRPDTIYFGGGTPSLLSPEAVARLIAAAAPRPGAEITLEANPETVDATQLAAFRAAGVNRISFGVQSARDAQLRTLGRPHTAEQARQAFRDAKAAGFQNICGDIMLALPKYSRAEFDETLALIEGGGATHISAYLLKIEPDSAFGKCPPAGLPDGDAAADFYLYAVAQLEKAGYRQYEISNFARPGFEGRHNLIYWNCSDYLGLGPAAHSCIGGKRFYFAADTEAFVAGTAHPIADGGCGAEDFFILQLRLTKGLDLAEYKRRGGKPFSAVQEAFLARCVENGYARYDGHTLALTPAGLIVQNSILAELL
ncbi:MAG: radical SAM family heme chaperone HemW [Faecalibacterium sp.]|jgi:oxygen-independent coproporphyrinogen-3 oxidase|nr:radical SAM family heme chaperone HemW [Faecalibacterium sp.]